MKTLPNNCAVCLRPVYFDGDGKRFTGVPGLVVCGPHCAQTVIHWVNFPLTQEVNEALQALQSMKELQSRLREEWDRAECALIEVDTVISQMSCEAERLLEKFGPNAAKNTATPSKGGDA